MSKKNREQGERNKIQQSAVGGETTQESKSGWSHWLALLVIIAAPIITYRNSPAGEFQFDDHEQLVENPDIRTLKGVFVDSFRLGTRIVSWFTFYLNYKLDGYNVFYYHLFNIGFHIINCILIYFVVLLLLRKAGIDKPYLALLTSLFFALHPINSEPLNYIVHGRYMTLCTMFYLGGFLSFILAFEPQKKKWLYLTVCLLCWILSILSKEVGVTLPGVLFFYYVLFVAKDRKEVFRTSLLFGVCVALAIFAIWSLSGVIKEIYHMGEKETYLIGNASSLFLDMQGILLKLNADVFGLSLYILPLPSRLNVTHTAYLTSQGASVVRISFSILIITGLIFWTIWTIRRNRLTSFSLLWLFIAHLPTTFINRGVIFTEYLNYLPFFGFALLAILCLSKIFSHFKSEKQYTIIAILIISTSFVFADMERNKVWENGLTLWNDSLMKDPNSNGAYSNRGLVKGKLGDYKGALEDFNRSIELSPYEAPVYNNRGNAKSKLGDYKGAIVDYNKAIELNLNCAEVYNSRGNVKDALGDSKGAIVDYNKAIELNPNYAKAYSNRGKVKYMISDYKGAMDDWGKAIEFCPPYKEKLELLINEAKTKVK